MLGKRTRRVDDLDNESGEGTPPLLAASPCLAAPKQGGFKRLRRRAQAVASDSESEASRPPAASPTTPELAIATSSPSQEDLTASVPAVSSAVAAAQAAAARAAAENPVQFGGRLDSLVGMGFLPGRARSALQDANGNLNMAIDICLGNRRASAVAQAPSRLPTPVQSLRGASGRPARAPVNQQPVAPVSARAKRAAKRQQDLSSSSSEASDPELCESGSAEGLPDPFDASSGSESGARPRCAKPKPSAIIRAEVSSGGDDSDVSIASNRKKKKGPATRALREVSATAQGKLLEALAGPVVEGETDAALRRRRVDVRKSISRGHTKLRTDYWPNSQDLIDRCEKYRELKMHQCVGVRWMLALHECVPGMILADEMGLGKTAQALCFLELLGSKRPSLVVAPASVLRTWETEAARWTPRLCTLKVHAPSYAGRMDAQEAFFRDPEAYQIVITTPQSFNSKENRDFFFRRVQFEYLIVDEAHGLKNASTLRYKEISKTVKCEHRLLLTGTPVQNSLAELATLMAFALSDGKKNKVSEELTAISEEPLEKALQQMQAAAAPLILRRLKSDVLSELPDKHGLVVYCDLTAQQRAVYDEEMAGARRERVARKGPGAASVKDVFLRLRRVCMHPLLCKRRLSKEQNEEFVDLLREKRPDFQKASRQRCQQEVLTWNDFDKHQAALQYSLSDQFLAKESELLNTGKVIELLRILKKQAENGDKTLVFSQFTQLLDIIEVVFRVSGIEFVRLDGKTAIEDRAGLVADFHGEGGPKVFLLSTKAGGLGLTLTVANAVVMLDLDFNPQNTRQAEDRVHRLGQLREVTIYYLVCRGTVEELVLNRNVEKMKLDQQFGGKRGALEEALGADAGEVDGEAKGEEEDDADDNAAQAKDCEKSVLQQLKAQLASVGG